MGTVRRGKPRNDEDRGLTHAIILDGALDLIEETGLEKFSVRLLAQKLSVYPAAIYWRFPTRNALLAELVNHVLRGESIDADTGDWKHWLASLLRHYRKLIYRHPKIAPLFMSQLLSNAGADFSLQDNILGALKNAGFSGDRLFSAYDIIMVSAIGFVTMELATAPEDDDFGFSQVMKQRIDDIDAQAHPHLAEHREEMQNQHFVLRWDNGMTCPLDKSFDDFVYTIIEGLRQLLTR